MFLDRELAEIEKAKDRLILRGELRRGLLRLDLVPVRARLGSAFSWLRAGLAAADLVKVLLGRR